MSSPSSGLPWSTLILARSGESVSELALLPLAFLLKKNSDVYFTFFHLTQKEGESSLWTRLYHSIALPRMPPPAATHLTKEQIELMRLED